MLGQLPCGCDDARCRRHYLHRLPLPDVRRVVRRHIRPKVCQRRPKTQDFPQFQTTDSPATDHVDRQAGYWRYMGLINVLPEGENSDPQDRQHVFVVLFGIVFVLFDRSVSTLLYRRNGKQITHFPRFLDRFHARDNRTHFWYMYLVESNIPRELQGVSEQRETGELE